VFHHGNGHEHCHGFNNVLLQWPLRDGHQYRGHDEPGNEYCSFHRLRDEYCNEYSSLHRLSNEYGNLDGNSERYRNQHPVKHGYGHGWRGFSCR